MNRSCPDEKPRCRILAVDDEHEVRNAYQHALTFDPDTLQQSIRNVFSASPAAEKEVPHASRGFDLTVAEQGEEAVALMQQALQQDTPFSVAFIDMRMPPGIDGLETAKALRALDKRIYIVFVTAYSDRSAEELDRVMEHEILLLRKPFVNEEIYQLARNLSRSWQKDRRLEQALEQAEQASAAKDQFLAAMSHELRTPLSSLLGYNELLLESTLNSEQHAWALSIEQAGKGLLYRINDVLDSSLVSSGRLELHPSQFSLSQLVDELQESYRIPLQRSGLRFEIACNLVTPDLRSGDRDRLLQILTNLLGNAVKFTPAGEVRLTLADGPQPEALCITVEDSGIGMSHEVLESAFHPFEQGEQGLNRSYGGIGMGLHISLQLARAMGGTLEAESVEGRGSRFTLTLPLPLAEAATATPTSEPEQTPPPTASSQQLRGRLLLVEDTPEMQLLIQRILQRFGLEAEVASNGAEGVEQVMSGHYDLILMDMQMPVMGGIEATRLLRQLGYTVPVVALTANITASHRQQFHDAGGDDLLNKPVNREQLKLTLEKYLQRGDALESDSSLDTLIDDELATVFRTRCTDLHQQLLAAEAHSDWDAVRFIAHTTKGSGETFGYPQLSTLGKKICDLIDEEAYHPLPPLVAQLVDALAGVNR